MSSAPTRLAPASFLKLSADVAGSYGFRPVRDLLREIQHPDRARHTHNFATVVSAAGALSRGSTSPVLAYYATSSPSHLPSHLSPKEVGEVGLQVIGTQESVGEIVLLKVLETMLTEWGAKLSRVRVNALGDKESKMRFGRELSIYVRKHAPDLCENCQVRTEKDPFAAHQCTEGTCAEVLTGSPRAMNFLSEKSRGHFREVLEHLEKLNLPYEIDDLLVGDDRDPRVIFALDMEDDATVMYGTGGRFDDYVRRVTGSKEATGVSASVFFRKKGLANSHFQIELPSRRPRVYFVQLGLQAKISGLAVTDVLRRARVPVLQSFDASQLSPQLSQARSAGVSHLIIMGQREALDGTVILRAMDTSAQTILPVSQLARMLKTLK